MRLRKFISILFIFILLLTQSYASAQGAGANFVQGIYHVSKNTRDSITIYFNKSTECNSFTLENPDRIVVDIAGAKIEGGYQSIPVTSSRISALRCSQFEEEIVRVVLDLNENKNYEIEQNRNSIVIGVFDGEPEEIGAPTSAQATEEERIVKSAVTFKHQKSQSEETIEVALDGWKNLSVGRLTDPNRIVIYFSGVEMTSAASTVNIDSAYVENISCSQFAGDTVRIIADLNGQYAYTYEDSNGLFKLHVKPSALKNVTYSNCGDRVSLVLSGIKLTSSQEADVKYHTSSYDPNLNDITVTYSTSRGSIGTGEIKINDDYVNSIKVTESGGNTTILIDGKVTLKYLVYYRSVVANTAITLIEPASNSRTVVIDPGHGGYDPGVVRGDTYESKLNLDICLRLEKLLKAQGVSTYVTRSKDTFVDTFERAYVANLLGGALFLSVHNNSTTYESERGSAALCYSTSGPSYVFAKIALNKMLAILGTRNHGIFTYPNFTVLKETVMPSIIAEVAFVSNELDRANLNTEAFREKAAEALCAAAIEMLGNIP